MLRSALKTKKICVKFACRPQFDDPLCKGIKITAKSFIMYLLFMYDFIHDISNKLSSLLTTVILGVGNVFGRRAVSKKKN